MLTLKRILAAWLLWCAANLVAMGLLTTAGVIGVEGRISKLSDVAQLFIWILVSLALGVGCVKLSWAKIK